MPLGDGPMRCLVVGGVVLEAAVEDADESVGEGVTGSYLLRRVLRKLPALAVNR